MLSSTILNQRYKYYFPKHKTTNIQITYNKHVYVRAELKDRLSSKYLHIQRSYNNEFNKDYLFFYLFILDINKILQDNGLIFWNKTFSINCNIICLYIDEFFVLGIEG